MYSSIVALGILENKPTFCQTKSGDTYQIKAKGMGPEYLPCEFWLKKNEDAWSGPFKTIDLSLVCLKAGFGLQENHRTREMDDYLKKKVKSKK